MADDGTISSFLAITGISDVTQASSYLEMSGGDLETAVGLYLEHNAAGSANAGAGAGGGGTGMDGVRAPDAVQRDRLVEDIPMQRNFPPMMMQMMGGTGNAFVDARAMANAMNVHHRDVWGGDDDDDDDFEEDEDRIEILQNGGEEGKAVDTDDDEGDDTRYVSFGDGTRGFNGGGGGAGSSVTLSDIFSPPRHLMYTDGGFQGARTAAKEQKKWLLVNIQTDTDFACHALNRDVWRDDLVINMVQDGFVFWQSSNTSGDGMTYCQRYSVHGYPHIAILDPRTGRSMWKKEAWTQVNPLQAGDFAQIISDFCSRYSFDEPPRAIPRTNTQTTSGITNKRPIDSLTEDEQLQAAIAASMNEDASDDTVIEESDDKIMADAQISGDKENKKSSMVDELENIVIGDEPSKGPRVQFRMPDGKRIVRRFNGDDHVKVLYAFILESIEEVKSGRSFELKTGFPPEDLYARRNELIKECDLAGATVNFSWSD